MVILLLLFLSACASWVLWLLHTRRLAKATESLPGVPGLPLLGNAMLFIGNTEKILKNLQNIADMAYKHKGTAKIWLGPKLYVAVGNPEDVQVILDNCLDKDVVYRFLRPWLGYGLFVAPLELWKAHRKVMRSVFNNKVVEEYVEVFAAQAAVLVQKLESMVGKGDFDVLKFITACTLDIVFANYKRKECRFHQYLYGKRDPFILKTDHKTLLTIWLGTNFKQIETAMGERMGVQERPDTPYLRARHTVMTILNMRFFKVWLQPDCLFKLTSYAKEHDESIKLTHKFTDEVVKKKRAEYEKNNHNNNTDGKLKAVLDLLFGREIEFTDEQLREHIDSITIAGNDTTALTIAYTLMLLGINKEAQEKVIQEQRSIFGGSKRGASKEDLSQMVYLERVLKESMRLYTVVPIIARNVDKDIYLPGTGITLAAGTGCVVGSFAMHRSTAVWGPDAARFDPDRFLPERSVDRHRAAFVPFSFGPRNCIGRNYGMLILKSVMSSIIRSYEIDADEVGPLKMELLLFPIRGHQIRITRREDN